MTGIPDLRLPRRSAGVFAYTALDALPVTAAVTHLLFVGWIIVGFHVRSWTGNLLCGCGYAFAMAWNINGISHNFVHTPYFRLPIMNRFFGVLESVAIGFSQSYYQALHLQHHIGNADRPDQLGRTRDPLSIYRHGRDGAPEPLWRYMIFGALRDEAPGLVSDMRRKRPRDAAWLRIELAVLALCVVVALIVDWRAVLLLVPFNVAGQALSQLSGYFEHYRGNPDEPIAWGVSSTSKVYNVTWFGNGFHAEHHFRPGVHWSKLGALHHAIASEQEARGTHRIATSHLLGFLAKANRRSR